MGLVRGIGLGLVWVLGAFPGSVLGADPAIEALRAALASERVVLEKAACLGYSPVMALTYSDDGRWIATGHVDQRVAFTNQEHGKNGGGITIWARSTLEPVNEFEGNRFGVSSLVFAPDGSLVSSLEDGTIRVRDIETGRELRRLGEEYRSVSDVRLSPAGNRLLAGASHPLTNWPPRAFLDRFLGILFPVRFGGELQLWDFATGSRVRRYLGNRYSVTRVGFSRDGTYIAALSFFEHIVRVWRTESEEPVAEIEASRVSSERGARFNDLAVLPRGRRIAIAGRRRSVVWDFAADTVIDRWEGGANEVEVLAGSSFVVSILPTRLVVRDVERKQQLLEHELDESVGRFIALAAAPEGRHFAVGTSTGCLLEFRHGPVAGPDAA